MKKSIFIFLCIIPVWLYSQTGIYKPLGGGMNNGSVFSLAIDSIDNILYSAGSFNQLGGFISGSTAKWNGSIWDSIPELPNTIKHFQFIDGILYAFGDKSIWKKNAGIWTEIASSTDYNGITGIVKYNGSLLLMGYFDTLNSIPLNSFAQYDGTNLTPFSNYLSWPLGGEFSTAAVYNNELYVGGLFTDTSGTLRNLMKWNGTQWVSVGTGISGPFARVYKLTVYNNNLFVAGEFNEASGNPGNAIFSYDGNTFNDLDGGLQLAVNDMIIHDGKLFLTGPCQSSSGREFKGFLTYNGTDFCYYDSIPCSSTPWPSFSKISFYNDSLIVAGGILAYNGDTIRNIATYIGDYTVSKGCEQVIGINEIFEDTPPFSVYPNPAQSIISIDFSANLKENTTLEIKNTLGQTIQQFQLAPETQKTEIDVSRLQSGLYFLQLKINNKLCSKKFVKQ